MSAINSTPTPTSFSSSAKLAVDPTEKDEMKKVTEELVKKGSPKGSPRSSRSLVRLDRDLLKEGVEDSNSTSPVLGHKDSSQKTVDAVSPVLGKGHRSNSTPGTKV